MRDSETSDKYGLIAAQLFRMRQASNLSQAELGHRLGRRQQWVSQIETGRRRIDVVEFCQFVSAMGADPRAAFDQVAELFDPAVPEPPKPPQSMGELMESLRQSLGVAPENR